MNTYTIEQIKKYLNTKLSIEKAIENLSDANIYITNIPDKYIDTEGTRESEETLRNTRGLHRRVRFNDEYRFAGHSN